MLHIIDGSKYSILAHSTSFKKNYTCALLKENPTNFASQMDILPRSVILDNTPANGEIPLIDFIINYLQCHRQTKYNP